MRNRCVEKTKSVMKLSVLFLVFSLLIAASLPVVSAKNITIDYPLNVTAGQVFQVNLTLVNFSEGIYDVKVDITNSSDDSDRLSKIFNGSSWQTTYDYVLNATNTSASNNSIFSLNITKNYNGTGNITVKIRKLSVVDTFSGYSINITPAPVPVCIQNWSCTSWSTCSSSSQSRTCSDTSNCGNNTGKPAESQACTSEAANTTVDLDITWNEDDIINGNEFEIEVKAYHLGDYSYDLKIWIEFEDNDTIISQRYDENLSEWKSGTYYLNDFFDSAGDKTEDVKIRIDEKYGGFYGDARIKAKLRKSGSIVKELDKYIEVLKGDSTSSDSDSGTLSEGDSSSAAQASANTNNESSPPAVIILGGSKKAEQKKPENSIIYKSKNERIKEYTPYFFGGICVFLIILLMAEKSKSAMKPEDSEELQQIQ